MNFDRAGEGIRSRFLASNGKCRTSLPQPACAWVWVFGPELAMAI